MTCGSGHGTAGSPRVLAGARVAGNEKWDNNSNHPTGGFLSGDPRLPVHSLIP